MLSHQRVIFQNTYFWKTLELIYARHLLATSAHTADQLLFYNTEAIDLVLIARFATSTPHEAAPPFPPRISTAE